MLSKPQEFQSNVLKTYGARAREIEELSAYNQNVFQHLLVLLLM